ncbi:MAG: hypothetical protein ACI8WB_000632 [Phenylobacterium sp.]|jgi:hypothetical protein
MTLYRIQQHKQHRTTSTLLTVLVLLSCLFVQCSLFMQTAQAALSVQQGVQQVMSSEQMTMDHHQMANHDCCESELSSEPVCCETPQLSSIQSFSVDQWNVALIATFSGFNGLIPPDADGNRHGKFLSSPSLYGPPVRVTHCCFQI